MKYQLGINMGRINTIFVLALIACTSLSGCLTNQKEDSKIDIIVNADTTNAMIIEAYNDGVLVSKTNVLIEFDFSQTTATNELSIFGIDKMDGTETDEIAVENSSKISVNFTEHGIYDITAYAIDKKSNRENFTITITIELRINWQESDTNEPMPLPFDPVPNNGGDNPSMIEIFSQIENPSLIGGGIGGENVQLTWQIVDELNDICQTRNGQVNDGETITWETLYFNTYLQHELRVVLDDSQESINVNQTIIILYS